MIGKSVTLNWACLLATGSCSRSIAENFRTKILNEHDRDSGSVQTPVRTLGSVSFLYLRHSDLYILSLVKSNVNVMLAFKFMTSVSTVG